MNRGNYDWLTMTQKIGHLVMGEVRVFDQLKVQLSKLLCSQGGGDVEVVN